MTLADTRKCEPIVLTAHLTGVMRHTLEYAGRDTMGLPEFQEGKVVWNIDVSQAEIAILEIRERYKLTHSSIERMALMVLLDKVWDAVGDDPYGLKEQ